MKLIYRDKDLIRVLLILEKDIYRRYKQLSFDIDDFEARAELKNLINEESKIIRLLGLDREKYNEVCEFIAGLYHKPIDVNIPILVNPLINGEEFLKEENYIFYRVIAKCHEHINKVEKNNDLTNSIRNLEVALLYSVITDIKEGTEGICEYFTRLLNMYSFHTLIDASREESKMLSYRLDSDYFIKDAIYNYNKSCNQIITEGLEPEIDESNILNHRKYELDKLLSLLAVHIHNNMDTFKITSRYYLLTSYIKVILALSPINFRCEIYSAFEQKIIEKYGENSPLLNVLYEEEADIENNIVYKISSMQKVKVLTSK